MSTTPDQSWINIFTAEIQKRYEDTGWFLPNLCTRAAVDGANLYWHQIGKVADDKATTRKNRYTLHTLSGLEHGMVSIQTSENELVLAIERLDLIKTNIDYRGTYASRMLDKMGRVVDGKGTTVFYAGKNATNLGSAVGAVSGHTNLSLAHIQQARETFDLNYIPHEGRMWIVDPSTWSLLERIPEFSNADYIGYDALPFKSRLQSKMFQTFQVIQWPALARQIVKADGSPWVAGTDNVDLQAGTVARTMMFQRDCFGYGDTLGLETKITYENLVSAWVIVMQMSNGYHIVDNTGTFEFRVNLGLGVDVPQYGSVVVNT